MGSSKNMIVGVFFNYICSINQDVLLIKCLFSKVYWGIRMSESRQLRQVNNIVYNVYSLYSPLYRLL